MLMRLELYLTTDEGYEIQSSLIEEVVDSFREEIDQYGIKIDAAYVDQVVDVA